MTAPRKALIRYGLLTAGALICAVLAALGALRVSPLLVGQVKSVCLVAVAVAMAIQGADFFPRSWPSRLIVKPHALAAGSLILFVGAALLLVMLFAGCSSARAERGAYQINFYGSESTATWTLFGADGPGRLAAQDLPRKTQRIKPGRRPAEAILRACGAGIAICAGSNRAGECSPGGTSRCREQATK
jgi:hypothetical protein